MPSEWEIRKLYVKKQTVCIEFFFSLLGFFSVRRTHSRYQRRRSWGFGDYPSTSVLVGTPLHQNRKCVYICIACQFAILNFNITETIQQHLANEPLLCYTTNRKAQFRSDDMINILVLEDDVVFNKSVCTYLNDSGFIAKGCLNAYDAYNSMGDTFFDLIISDIMMPEIDGFEFAESVRRINKQIPILFMSARDDLPAKQKGFRLGIDDYMVKPIDFEELLLRVRALLRRANIEMEKKLTVGNLVLDGDGMTAEVDGEEVPVTPREFNILFKLLSYPKKIFSRAQLMDEFWEVDTDASLRSVDVYVTKLRDKFSGCDGFEIKTVRGVGYKAVLK